MNSLKKIIICSTTALLALGCTQKDSTVTKIYNAPAGATEKLEGGKIPYCLSYDPNKWVIIDTPFNESQKSETWDWTLLLSDTKDKKALQAETPPKGTLVFTFSDTEKNRTPEQIKQRVQKEFLGNMKVDEFQDLGSEEKTVNGLKMFNWKFKTSYTKKDGETQAWIFDNYYYSGDIGSVSIVTMTRPEYWDENSKEIENLLNGICLSNKKQE